MSLASNNRATTRSLLEREIWYCRQQAREMRDLGNVVRAYALDREADSFETQLACIERRAA